MQSTVVEGRAADLGSRRVEDGLCECVYVFGWEECCFVRMGDGQVVDKGEIYFWGEIRGDWG